MPATAAITPDAASENSPRKSGRLPKLPLVLFTILFANCSMTATGSDAGGLSRSPHDGDFTFFLFRLLLKTIAGSGADLVVVTDLP